MTPKEKAEELFISYIYTVSNPLEPLDKLKADLAKQCALIAVDEVLNFINTDAFSYTNETYWQEVKQELNKQN